MLKLVLNNPHIAATIMNTAQIGFEFGGKAEDEGASTHAASAMTASTNSMAHREKQLAASQGSMPRTHARQRRESHVVVVGDSLSSSVGMSTGSSLGASIPHSKGGIQWPKNPSDSTDEVADHVRRMLMSTAPASGGGKKPSGKPASAGIALEHTRAETRIPRQSSFAPPQVVLRRTDSMDPYSDDVGSDERLGPEHENALRGNHFETRPPELALVDTLEPAL